jgi:hypothetical protein
MVEHEKHQIYIFHTYFLMYKFWFLNKILYFHYKLEYMLALNSLYLFRT